MIEALSNGSDDDMTPYFMILLNEPKAKAFEWPEQFYSTRYIWLYEIPKLIGFGKLLNILMKNLFVILNLSEILAFFTGLQL